jgi:hypothetical protein
MYLDNLSIGGLFTARNYDGGLGDNAVIGPDVVWRSAEGDRVRGQWLLSTTSALAGDDGQLHKGAAQGGSDVLVDWIRKTPNWEPSLTYQQVSDNFRDDTGFFGQAGYRQLTAQLVQKNRTGHDLNEIDPYVLYQQSVTTDDGSTVQRLFAPGITVYGPHNTSVDLEYRPSMAQRVAAGDQLHSFSQLSLDVQSNPAAWMPFLEAKTILGDQVDLENNRVSPGLYTLVDARFRALDRLEIEPRFEQTVLRGPGGDTALRDTAVQLLTVLHFTGQDSARAILQRETTRRSQVLATDVGPSYYQSDSVSLTYAHRWSALRVWYLGATWSQNMDTGSLTTRDAEVFTKFQFEI